MLYFEIQSDRTIATRDSRTPIMGDEWGSPKSRRLSRLPVPITGFRKTRVLSNFTASPLAESCVRMEINDHEDYRESPAKLARCEKSKLRLVGPSAHAVEPRMLSQSLMQETRRFSLAPNHESILSTPPQRKMTSRKSLAPNPYGIHVGGTHIFMQFKWHDLCRQVC